MARQGRLQGIDDARIHQRFLERAYIEDDEAAAAKEIRWFAGRPEEYLSFGLRAARLNLLGKRAESRKLFRRAAKSAQLQVWEALLRDLKKPMRELTICSAITQPYVDWGVPRWPSQCVANSQRRRSLSRRIPTSFRPAPSGMRCGCQRSARPLKSSAIGPTRRSNRWHPPCCSNPLIRRLCTSEVRLTCVCVRAQR